MDGEEDISLSDSVKNLEIECYCGDATTDRYVITLDDPNMMFNDGKPFSDVALFDEAKEARDKFYEWDRLEWEKMNLPSELSDHSAQDDPSKNEIRYEDYYNPEFEGFGAIKDDSYETGDIVMEETSHCLEGFSILPKKPLESAFEELGMNDTDEDRIECLR
ncbi:hypothetical protein CAEBREN_09133 [Caenorhabditis brenneri]|uniref:Uncharacterized protein n=1 Tax=Caenorhabditis brenneri TaxID=135651 RepID=G0MRR7_CAEBE|nr:hypothetical protein CAEBREN_09133 [Caenorhabditis brenneri]